MYSSLHKIDLIVTMEDGPLCVQTDHRDRAEIEAQRELSIVFAATRVLVPGFADPARRRVEYTCIGEAPAFLRDVVRACGGSLVERGDTSRREAAGATDLDAVGRMVDEALRSLGREVLARYGLDATFEGVAQLERALRAEDAPDREHDEIRYYERIVELAAAGGAAIAGTHASARWRVTEQLIATVPFALEIAEGRLANVFGRTERYLDGEVDAGPSALAAIRDPGERAADAPVVGILKPAWWLRGQPYPALTESVLRDGQGPIIAYAHDYGESVGFLNAEDAGLSLEAARDAAQAFYRAIAVELEPLADDPAVWVVSGDYYATEKLLDRAFARDLHRRLGSETLLVGLPARGVAAVVPAKSDLRLASRAIASFVDRTHAECAPADRISALPFIMIDGELTGFLAIERDPDKPVH